MSDTEQQAKTTTEDVAMEDAPATTEQDAAPAADEAPAKDSAAVDTEEAAPAAEEETNEKEEKAASSEKPVSSKSKNKPSVSARKDGNSTRKLAGKIAKADAKESSKGKFSVGDVVLGKLKGYPAWRERSQRTGTVNAVILVFRALNSMYRKMADERDNMLNNPPVMSVLLGIWFLAASVIVDRDNVPKKVAKERPKSSTIVCIQYFPTGEYSWLSPSDIKPLPKHEIDAYLKNTSRKTSGDLYQAYQIAGHPKEWIAEREEEQIAEKEAGEKKPTPADDEDELAEEDDEEEATAKSGGKRKRIATEKKTTKEKPASKRAKTDKAPPKKAAKSKDADEEAPVSKKAAKSKTAANKKAPASTGKKAAPTSAAKETKESKEAKEDANDDPMSSDPEAVRVRDWRHKLQRAFLSKSVPSSEEMETYDKLFTTIENYQNMTVAYLAHSKIGKVMKKIAALTNIPKNDDLKITDRAHALMQKWTDQIDNGKPAEAIGNGDVEKGEATAEATKEEPAKDEPKENAAKETDAEEENMDIDEEEKDEKAAEESGDKEAAPADA
ncbi:hypothetical protein QFC21_000775 [Naganishia friedmannii]|uniref:Uncharacterized protein n=1 Tax=Naganishia friedmannii TaxID=89922 RepID=A0ACC2W8A6_9TREE|nr:hypothetical protein QFC21_000775 [Naganishia friedmannii]